jgi:hypothetical protein
MNKTELENTPNYVLYTQALGDIDATLDNIKDSLNNTDNGSYFSEISNSLDNLVTQTFELNKTMNNIAKSLRVISHNNR